MILISYGTRPEWLKIKPILKQLKKENITSFKTLFIQQHSDLIHGEYDYCIKIKDSMNRLDSIVSSILNNESIFYGIDYVMIQGDTCSAFSVALTAFHRKIKIIHLEAGLRTWDACNPYPEEFYRQSISSMANIHLAPTNINKENLVNEKRSNIFVVGNTSIDNLIKYKTVKYDKKILITLHRRENHDQLNQWFEEISKCATLYKDWDFTFIEHPNPNVQKNINHLRNVIIIKPQPHEKLLEMISSCGFIISDSGGLQEEASYFKKYIIVCRKTTERPESLGVTSKLCLCPEDLIDNVKLAMNNYQNMSNSSCMFGNGDASNKIIQILKNNNII